MGDSLVSFKQTVQGCQQLHRCHGSYGAQCLENGQQAPSCLPKHSYSLRHILRCFSRSQAITPTDDDDYDDDDGGSGGGDDSDVEEEGKKKRKRRKTFAMPYSRF